MTRVVPKTSFQPRCPSRGCRSSYSLPSLVVLFSLSLFSYPSLPLPLSLSPSSFFFTFSLFIPLSLSITLSPPFVCTHLCLRHEIILTVIGAQIEAKHSLGLRRHCGVPEYSGGGKKKKTTPKRPTRARRHHSQPIRAKLGHGSINCTCMSPLPTTHLPPAPANDTRVPGPAQTVVGRHRARSRSLRLVA